MRCTDRNEIGWHLNNGHKISKVEGQPYYINTQPKRKRVLSSHFRKLLSDGHIKLESEQTNEKGLVTKVWSLNETPS